MMMSVRRLLCVSTALALAGLGACGADDSGAGFGDSGLDSAGGGIDDGDPGAGTGGAGDGDGEPPPEMEDEGDFRVPRASGRFVYSASEATDSVAVIDSSTLAIDVVGVGRGPTVVAPLNAEGLVAVLDQGSDDVALLRTDDSGETSVEIIPSSPGANNLAVSPDETLVYVYHDVDGPTEQGPGSDQELTAIDVQTQQVYEMTVGAHPREIVFESTNERAYVVTDDGVNVVITAEIPMTGKPDLLPVVDDPAIDPANLEIQVAANQRTALARVAGDTRLFVTDLVSGELQELALPGPATDVDIVADGSFAIVTVPSTQGSRFVEIALPVDPGVEPVIHDVDGEYVGLAHLSPDGETMLLYTTVNPFGSESPLQPGWADPDGPMAGGGSGSSGGSDTGGSSTGDEGTTGDGSSDDGGDDGDDSGAVPPDQDPRQRITIARRGEGDWSERITLFMDYPIDSVGMAPDGENAMLMHEPSPDGGATPWSYTLLDVSKEFPVKKLQMVEAEPGAVVFTPEGDRSVVLLRDDATGVRRVDLVDLRSFIVDGLGLGSPPEGAGYVEATDKIFVSQEHPTGRITFLDRDSGVETVTGFRLNDAVKD